MSKALKCDHCFECFDPLETDHYIQNERLHITNMEIMDPIGTKNNRFIKQLAGLDFCPKCTNKLRKWFAGEADIIEVNDK